MSRAFETPLNALACLSFLLAFLLVVSATVVAETGYDALASRYLSLRNTDIDIVKSDEWEELGKDFLSYADKNARSAKAPEALFKAAILYEQLYRRFGGRDRLEKCTHLFDRLARDYPGNISVDDALV
ncbi:MAG: hypothetical protein KDD42_09840, partial [Bdellovibrionales bacterium]|nr:hypothetical protein [Bdellovibrionales bacterium]